MSDRTDGGSKSSIAASARWPSTASIAEQRRAPRQLAHDVGFQAASREKRRLYGDRVDLRTRAGVGIDEDHRSVSPRRLTGLAGHYLEGTAGDR
jgi:hypothetical protein